MATDSNEREADTPAPVGVPIGGGMTRLPNGVVLDKDGKPCRSCTSKSAFSAFAAQARQAKGQQAPPPATAATSATTATTTAQSSWSECPPDVEELGRSSWTLLHSIAASYPKTPSPAQQSDLVSFVHLFSRLYPCWVCAEDFKGYISREPPQAKSRDDFGMWLCRAHNDVNVKLGKPMFDCSKWLERWKTGPADGRCD
ncbi:mitochondrial FAD-linked sulfhydryl oxidase [Geosmithia morbida]|uniref:Sulfhydryl oxidase n=1 Tax=Geosmithia morbida TaxID=1094350 RepID=A0A9P4YTM9_9HYPO|nr:mitochondrial FAD-linked sulfhydryl oxidase [Geosmithia morbida]KAF4121554.1 mitochondrial FAD-linked sulfhydryl oxidase [Geosmithia morbida]